MKTAVPWALLAAYAVYRRTWGQCDCDGLRRRLACANRETAAWQHEARVWFTKAHQGEMTR